MRFLIINFFRKKNGRIDEVVRTAKTIEQTDIETANVVVDYVDKKVVKCIIDGLPVNTGFPELNEYYKKIYPTVIENLELEATFQKPRPSSKLAKRK